MKKGVPMLSERCPACGRLMSRLPNGCFHWHHASTARYAPKCSGSGRTVEEIERLRSLTTGVAEGRAESVRRCWSAVIGVDLDPWQVDVCLKIHRILTGETA